MEKAVEIYLDNAATTKPYVEAVEAATRALAEEYGNPSSIHVRGEAAKDLLEQSRSVVARALGVDAKEIYFTSGATEANNLAIRGAAEARGVDAGSIVTSELEHPSVTRSVRGLRRAGFTTTHIPAANGVFDFDAFQQELEQRVQLVTVMLVQNELGYIFPIADIALKAHTYAPHALIHTDATQAFGKLEVSPRALGVDMLSISSHKLGGPKGIGALYVREGVDLFTMAFGGGQERGLRSGTEPVFLAAGFAAAVQVAMKNREQAWAHVSELANHLRMLLNNQLPDVCLLSREDGSPYIVAFALPGQNAKRIVSQLSQKGVCISAGSACSMSESMVPAGTWRPKHKQALQAAGFPRDYNDSMFRVSFSPANTLEEVDVFVTYLRAALR